MHSPAVQATCRGLRDDRDVDALSGSDLICERYELGELVASGGMGQVYAARDVKLDRAVALKFLRKDMAAQEDLRSRFEAEARAAGRLSHPNVVAVFDTDEHEGSPFIVMELLSGATLADEAAKGPATEQRARQLCEQVLSALAASHEQGILHRDLKPGNVLLTADGSVKVGDFGVAKMAEGMHMTQAGMLLGTPAYLAPERIDGEPASAGSDIYSVGVILYELLAGRKPFDADTPLGLIRAIQDEPVPSLAEVRPDVAPAFAAVVERAMARDPRVRYSSAAEMQADLVRSALPQAPAETASTAGTADTTRVMASAGAAGTDPTLVAQPAPGWPRVGAWSRLSSRNRMGVAIAATLILVSLLFFRGITAETPNNATVGTPPAGDTSGGSLPAPLEDALRQLERAVED